MVGYARCSTAAQDLTAQQEILLELGVAKERIYLDHGLTGRNRARPGLEKALAAVRAGDTLVVPKLDRLARSVPDARTRRPRTGRKAIPAKLLARPSIAPSCRSRRPTSLLAGVVVPTRRRPGRPLTLPGSGQRL